MRLDQARCEYLLDRAEHGVLSTLHADRGVDAVPVCFAIAGACVAIPVDRVKPKASVDLQRSRNLDNDPRAVLLCDHWDGTDWSQLWWVRVSLERVTGSAEERSSLETLLRLKYHQYEQQSFADLVVFHITEIAGWSGSDGLPTPRT